MTITEATRHALYERLEDVIGPEEATTLMEMLPPVGWADVATNRDLDHQTALLRSELRAESQLVAVELRREMQSLGTELRGEMQSLGTELRREMHASSQSTLRWSIGANMTIASLLFAAIKLF